MDRIYYITGLMSGSSLDGVDLAYCSFREKEGNWEHQIHEAETKPYPAGIRERLFTVDRNNKDQIMDLDLELAGFYALLLNDFHRRKDICPELIASHGHTLWHRPLEGSTFQAGNGKELARLTGIPVVSDFRSADVAQGGQGAPLVPVGDKYLFCNFESCLNLGGFANISYDSQEGNRIGFDIAPANLALNWSARKSGLDYDKDGKIAFSETPDASLFNRLNKLDYYGIPAPKSLGKEWFNSTFLPVVSGGNLRAEQLQATLTEHIGFQIGNAIRVSRARNVLVTGGGALNQALVRSIKNNSRAEIVLPDLHTIHFKEALVFAFLGLLKTKGEINCLSSVTGGKKDLSCGVIHQP